MFLLACASQPVTTDTCPPGIEEEEPAADTAVESVVGQGDTGDFTARTSCDGGSLEVELAGEQESDAWLCAGDEIVLHGEVTFLEGTLLTVEAGTTIQLASDGDALGALIVRGRILAEGTVEAPIVLKAADADDEGIEGFKLYGDAPGATNPEGDGEHDGGVLRYVRIEGGGLDDAAWHFVNVGRGTTLQYLGSVGSEDDGFELDGGTVEADHLVTFDCRDDGFQLEDGFVGRVSWLLSVACNGSGITTRNRDPDDSYDGDEPWTSATVWNASLISNYSEGIYFDEEGAGEYANLLVAEHSNCGTRIDDDSWERGGIEVHHLLLWDTDEPWCESESGHTLQTYVGELVEEDPLLDGWMPGEGSPALDPKLADTSRAEVLGAFSDEDWTAGWIVPP